MTVASNTPYDQYSATAAQTVFNYTFEIVEQTDIFVYQRGENDSPNDTNDLLVLNVDYTVAGAGNENGGTITLTSGATLDDVITLKQNVPVERDTSFTNGGVLRAEDLNNEYDAQMLTQQVTRFNEENRMLSYWDSAVLTDPKDLIIPVLSANQIFAMNNAGDEIIPYDVPAGGGLAPKLASYLIQTATSELPNAQAMGALATGFVQNTITTGVQATRVLTGTANQIDIANGNGAAGNPTWTVSSTLNLPGTFTIQGSTVVNEIINDATMATAGTDNLSTSYAIKKYVDDTSGGTATAIVGTANQVLANGTSGVNQTGVVTMTTPQDIATSSSPSFAGATFSAAVDMDSQLINNVLDPVDLQDAATKKYVDDKTPTLADGELYIGVTGDDPVANTLTAGSGISIAEGAGTITISGIASSIGWTEVTGITQAMDADSGYIANNVDLVTFTLPATAAVGTLLQVIGKGAGGWIIEQNAGQEIHVGNASTTAGVAGSIASTHMRDAVSFVCTTANSEWTAQNIQGILTIA